MALAPTPENFRAEIARHMLIRKQIGEAIGMRSNRVVDYVNGVLPLTGWAAHNIGLGINEMTGLRVFDVDEEKGFIRPKRGRPARLRSGSGIGLDPYVARSKRRYRRSA